MDKGAVRRIVFVLIAYDVVALLVLLVADWVAGVFALPPLFDTLLRWGLGLGLPVALLIAWKYPEIGHHGGEASSSGDAPREGQ